MGTLWYVGATMKSRPVSSGDQGLTRGVKYGPNMGPNGPGP